MSDGYEGHSGIGSKTTRESPSLHVSGLIYSIFGLPAGARPQ